MKIQHQLALPAMPISTVAQVRPLYDGPHHQEEVPPSAVDWRHFLPRGWDQVVESPLYCRIYREYEMEASRCIGYDADDQPCFAAHRFVLDTSGEPPGYAEEMAAWRLRDERWLVFRLVSTRSDVLPRGFYSISPEMPR